MIHLLCLFLHLLFLPCNCCHKRKKKSHSLSLHLWQAVLLLSCLSPCLPVTPSSFRSQNVVRKTNNSLSFLDSSISQITEEEETKMEEKPDADCMVSAINHANDGQLSLSFSDFLMVSFSHSQLGPFSLSLYSLSLILRSYCMLCILHPLFCKFFFFSPSLPPRLGYMPCLSSHLLAMHVSSIFFSRHSLSSSILQRQWRQRKNASTPDKTTFTIRPCRGRTDTTLNENETTDRLATSHIVQTRQTHRKLGRF